MLENVGPWNKMEDFKDVSWSEIYEYQTDGWDMELLGQ